MTRRVATSVCRKKGRGLITDFLKKTSGTVLNKAIDLLPVELHIPGYQFCGPGTNLKKRLARGDRGVNLLDAACKEHDIAYSRFSDNSRRTEADRVLSEEAWKRVKASDSSIGEKAAAWVVTTAMKAKTKFGGGKKRRRVGKKKKSITLLLNNLQGKGLYLKPWKKDGGGSKTKKRKCKKKKS